jgi:hypothetical protein
MIEYNQEEVKSLLNFLNERYRQIKEDINKYTEEPDADSSQAFCLASDKGRLLNISTCEQRILSMVPNLVVKIKQTEDFNCPTEFGKFANTLECFTKCEVRDQCQASKEKV